MRRSGNYLFLRVFSGFSRGLRVRVVVRRADRQGAEGRLSRRAPVPQTGTALVADRLPCAREPAIWPRIGSLAQLVERFVYTEDVGSSSLSRPTIRPSQRLHDPF